MDYDRVYANADFIEGASTFPAKWQREAAQFREGLGARAQLGLRYGPQDRNQFDLFMPDHTPRGVMVFIHGGYWLAFDRSDWSHLAAGALARGWACMMPSYTLAPQARIAQITTEIAAAICAVEIGGPIVVTGQSAGGHLAARMANADRSEMVQKRVLRTVPISPLADLAPLLPTAMNTDLRLTDAECASESPAHIPKRTSCEAHVWVGASERPAFLWQARTLSEEWSAPWTAAPAKHHFNVIDDLCNPKSALMDACLNGL